MLAAAAMVVLVGCSQVEAERRTVAEAYVAAHPGLPEEASQDILEGRIRRGMPREQVVASLGGLPCKPPVHRWASDGVDHEFCDLRASTRTQHRGRILLFRDDKLIGWEEYLH